MNEFDEACLEYFLAHQEQLLPEPVAETMEKPISKIRGLISGECHSRIWRRQAKYLPSRMADI